ncbi:MAG TPA: ABC transporter permease [Candidatus Angelobacter sp.]|nr:ABC transporter permease [Candidatus Angelobacter sp.]
MKKLWRLWARITGLFSKGERERDMAQEFESHLQMHVEDNIRAGMTPEEARRAAMIKFGGMESAKESIRETARVLWLETSWQDLRYALRGLWLNPGFATTAILSLALGIGASVAIYTVADNLLLRPLPYPGASELAMLWENNLRSGNVHNVVSPANYFDWKEQNTVFENIGGLYEMRALLGDGRHSEEVDVQTVSSEVLPLLRVQPVRGRVFTYEEDSKDAHVALISYRVWQNLFGGDENILGRQIQLNLRPFTVIGVLPPDFYFHTRSIDVWLTLGLNPSPDLRKGQGRWMMSIARRKPGVSLRQAQTEMTGIAKRLQLAYPAFDKNWDINVEPLRDSLVGQVKPSLLALLGAVTLLLAVACANVANLLLARYTARRREFAVRGALGAARPRLLRQLFTESLVLGLVGGALGIVLAGLAVSGLVALAPKELTRSVQVSFDVRILVIAVTLSVLTSVVFGLAPALVASRGNVNRALHEESHQGTGGGNRLRSWLVAGEVACSVILLAGAGLLFRTVIGLQAVDPGLNPDKVLTFSVSLPRVRYGDGPKGVEFFSSAAERLAQLPGVRSASAVSYLPFNGMAAGTRVDIAGRPPARPGEDLVTVVRTVQPGYFQTLGIPFKKGRDFTAADNVIASPYRFIVNEAFVRKYFPGEDPLGQQISVWMDDQNPFGEIIGVVGDLKEGTLDQGPEPTAYYVHAHLRYGEMVMVMRTDQDPLSLAEPARKVIQGLDRELPISDVRTMATVVRQTFARQQFSAVLLGGFSIASLLLAAVGIYGVLAYSVTQRTREIGVRVALGAEPRTIIRLIVGSGTRMVVSGALAGLAAALLLSGLLKSLLYGVGARDPLTFIAAPAVLVAVALVAAYVPARRAAKVSPMEALRAE